MSKYGRHDVVEPDGSQHVYCPVDDLTLFAYPEPSVPIEPGKLPRGRYEITQPSSQQAGKVVLGRQAAFILARELFFHSAFHELSADQVIEKLLADLTDRSGFDLSDHAVFDNIRETWRRILVEAGLL